MNFPITRISGNQIIPENILLHDINSLNIISVEIDPSDFCNFKCSWCFTKENRTKSKLNIEYLKSYIDNFIKMGGRSIHFSGGGEPLLYKELYTQNKTFHNKSIIEYCTDKNIAVGLITNGVYLNRIIYNGLVDKLSFVRISLDATSSKRYSLLHGCSENNFIIVKASIKQLGELRKEYIPAIGLSFIVDKEKDLNFSQADIKVISDLAKYLDVDFVQFKHLHSSDEKKAEEEMKNVHNVCCDLNWCGIEFWVHQYIAPKPKKKCIITKYIEVLTANQNISLCCHLYGIDKAKNNICNSKVCRYTSINELLINVNNKDNLNFAIDKLNQSITKYGFHPYRLFPSAPDLFTPITK